MMMYLTVETKDYFLPLDADLMVTETEDGWMVVDASPLDDIDIDSVDYVPGAEQALPVEGPFKKEKDARLFVQKADTAIQMFTRSANMALGQNRNAKTMAKDTRDAVKKVKGLLSMEDCGELEQETKELLELTVSCLDSAHAYLSEVDRIIRLSMPGEKES